LDSFLVPVYIKIGKLSDEKLLSGLFMIGSEHIWFHYSPKRLQFISQLSGASYAELAKTVFEQITSKVQQTNKQLNIYKDKVLTATHVFNIDYFEYLKKYAQNTIIVGEIQPLTQILSESLFSDFCKKLLNEKPEVIKVHKTSFHAKVKAIFKVPSIEQKVDIGLKITPTQLPGLNADITLALIAKNGSVLAADTLDFESSPLAIGNTLNAFDVLVYSLDKFSISNNLKKGKYHLLINEPKPSSEQEKQFNNIYKNKKDTYSIDSFDKVNDIKNEIEKEDYSKFSLALTT